MHAETSPPGAAEPTNSSESMQQARGLWPVLAATAMSSLIFFGVMVLVTQLLTRHMHLSESLAHQRFGLIMGIGYLLMVPTGLVVDRWLGAWRAGILGFGVLAVGCALLGLSAEAVVELGLLLFAVGAALSRTALVPLLGEQYLLQSRRMGGGFWAMGVALQVGAAPSGPLAVILSSSVGLDGVMKVLAVLALATAGGLWLSRKRLLPVAGEARNLPPAARIGSSQLGQLMALTVCSAAVHILSRKALATQDLHGMGPTLMPIVGWLLGWTVYRALRAERVAVSLWTRVVLGVLLLAPLWLAVWWQPESETLQRITQRGAWLASGMVDVLMLPTVFEAAMRWARRTPATAVSVLRLLSR